MAEHELVRLERVGVLRQVAQERRLAETRRMVEAACHDRDAAEQRSRQATARDGALVVQCYAAPADPQAWIARAHSASLADAAEAHAQGLRAEAAALARRKSEEARALLRGDARLGAIRQRLARARQGQRAREEEMVAEDFAMGFTGGGNR